MRRAVVVIASAAKQSTVPFPSTSLDCRVAALLAMTKLCAANLSGLSEKACPEHDITGRFG